MAICYQKTTPADERVIIPAVREAYIQPFTALNWLDLRVGFFLSVVGNADPGENDDTLTGLAETIPPSGDVELRSSDRYWIGLKTNGTALPRTRNVVFTGYTNSMHSNDFDATGAEATGSSQLLSATTVWLPWNTANNNWSAMITDGAPMRAQQTQTGSQLAFPRDATTVAAGYAALLAIRLTRPNVGPGGKRILMRIKRNTVVGGGGQVLFANTPTTELIESNLVDFPLSTVNIGPVELSGVPDALYFYWPFANSRLRIHAIGVYKAS